MRRISSTAPLHPPGAVRDDQVFRPPHMLVHMQLVQDVAQVLIRVFFPA